MKIKLIILIFASWLFLTACEPNLENAESPVGSQPTSVAVIPEELTSESTPSPASATSEPSLGSAMTISGEEATKLMVALVEESGTKYQDAVDRILEASDQRFIPVFIELLRANQLALVPESTYNSNVGALEQLSGQAHGLSWPAWVEWYGGTALEPPPGFTGWKGRLLGQIDPGFEEFLQDDFPSLIRVEEIQWGGVRVDGIPALDNPSMITPDEAEYLEPQEPVFGIAINGEARAYPLRIMDWHEMANDVVGGVPVSLAYCTLCGAGIAFDGRASDGNTYTFGSSGFLFRSNKLMYDRQTRTLWNQLTGEPVLGKLVRAALPDNELVQLELLPVVLTSWEEWLIQHPDTVVLDIDTGFSRPYEPGAAYGAYFASSGTMFPVWQRSDLLEAKARVFTLRMDGVPRAYPLSLLAKERVVNDAVGDLPVVLVSGRGFVDVAGIDYREGQVNYEAGGEVRAYARGEENFFPSPDADVVEDSQGRLWQVTEDALVSPSGERALRVNGHLAYWFGWFAFFPKTSVYGVEGG